MTLSSQFSSEFVDRAKAVLLTPEDYTSKTETLGLLMQMKALATSGNAMAQYRLAQVYSKNSTPYLTWMQTSADQGCTNAMLALSVAFAENGTVSGFHKAAQYLVKILSSDDSYIKAEAITLMETNRLLRAEVSRQLDITGLGKSAMSFFSLEMKATKKEESELQNTISTPCA